MSEMEGLDIVEEQRKDPEIQKILADLKQDKRKTKAHYIRHEEALYYLSHIDHDPSMRLFVPMQLRPMLIKAYHDENGHFGVDKCYLTLARSYY